MKSIQMKLLVLMMVSVLGACFFVALIALSGMNKILGDNDTTHMVTICNAESKEMDEQLDQVECAVETICQYGISEANRAIDDATESICWTQEGDVGRLMATELEEVSWCDRVYFFPSPELSADYKGLTYCRENGKGKALGDKEQEKLFQMNQDAKRFDTIVKTGKAAWTKVYADSETGEKYISYGMPVVYDKKCYGVIGMDVNVQTLREFVKHIKVYEEDAGCLLSSTGEILYSPDYPQGIIGEVPEDHADFCQVMGNGDGEAEVFRFEKSRRMVASKTLRSGNVLCLFATREAVIHSAREMMTSITLTILISVIVISGLVFFSLKTVLFPLKKVMTAAEKAAEGQYDVVLDSNYDDEVGMLARNLQTIINVLQNRVEYADKLAFSDVLTETKNKAAYEERITLIDQQIKAGEGAFGIVVMDVNGLKTFNEKYGHDIGDLVLQDAADLMKRTFGEDNVYRIEDDEFVAIMVTNALMEYHRMTQLFMREIEQFNQSNDRYEMRLTVAKGVSVYEKSRDLTYGDVYNRAKNLMAQNKKWIKGLE